MAAILTLFANFIATFAQMRAGRRTALIAGEARCYWM